MPYSGPDKHVGLTLLLGCDNLEEVGGKDEKRSRELVA
jgi:hypothetical protein